MFRYIIEEQNAGLRLDQFLQAKLPEHSRSRLQQWTKEGRALVNGISQKPSYTVRLGDVIEFSPGELPALRAVAEDLPIEVLYLDRSVLAVNKPAGMVVHAGAGRHSGTLVNALLHHFQSLSGVGGEERPGIVHRIDRDTSGVLLVARTDAAHRALAAQFASREVDKAYLTLVEGRIATEQGRIEAKIARDPVHRTRMTAKLGEGRTAISLYRVLERFDRWTYLEVRIATGRTHQIRVHLASRGHRVAGDTLYGAAPSPIGRFFLHAARIGFNSPDSGERIEVEAPLPPELVRWLDDCRQAT